MGSALNSSIRAHLLSHCDPLYDFPNPPHHMDTNHEPALPPLSTTVDHLLYTTTHHTSPDTVTESTTLCHVDADTIRLLIISSLPSLLLAQGTPKGAQKQATLQAPDSTSAPSRHIFTHSLQTGTTKSGKPIKAPFQFSLLLTESSTTANITFTTVTDSASLSPTIISGSFSFTPAPHGTTTFTVSASAGALQKSQRGLVTRPLSPGALDPTPLNHLLSLVPTLHARFARYDEVDRARYLAFEHRLTNNPPPIGLNENKLIDESVKADDESSSTAFWKRISGTIKESVAYFHKTTNNANWGKAGEAPARSSSASMLVARLSIHSPSPPPSLASPPPSPLSFNTRFARAVAIIDAPASRVLSFIACRDNYEAIHEHIAADGAGAFRIVINVSDFRSMVYVNMVLFGVGVSNRIFSTLFAWREEADGAYVLAFAPLEDWADKERVMQVDAMIAQHALASKAIRGIVRGFWRFKPLAPTICELTYVMCVKLGGSIPKEVLSLRKKQTLSVVQSTQDRYERKGEIADAEMRSAFPSPPPLAELDDEQRAIVENSMLLESGHGGEWEHLTSPSPFTTMCFQHTKPQKGERCIALGRALATIDCPMREAIAWYYASCSRERLRISTEGGSPARLVVQDHTVHDNVVATIKKMPFPFKNREFVGRQLCLRDSNGDLLLVMVPANDVLDYGKILSVVRATLNLVLRFHEINSNQCSVTMNQKLDAYGNIPSWLANKMVASALKPAVSLRDAFQRDDEIDKLERDQLARFIKDEPQNIPPRKTPRSTKSTSNWACSIGSSLRSLSRLTTSSRWARSSLEGAVARLEERARLLTHPSRSAPLGR